MRGDPCKTVFQPTDASSYSAPEKAERGRLKNNTPGSVFTDAAIRTQIRRRVVGSEITIAGSQRKFWGPVVLIGDKWRRILESKYR